MCLKHQDTLRIYYYLVLQRQFGQLVSACAVSFTVMLASQYQTKKWRAFTLLYLLTRLTSDSFDILWYRPFPLIQEGVSPRRRISLNLTFVLYPDSDWPDSKKEATSISVLRKQKSAMRDLNSICHCKDILHSPRKEIDNIYSQSSSR